MVSVGYGTRPNDQGRNSTLSTAERQACGEDAFFFFDSAMQSAIGMVALIDQLIG
jgi:hypothetical protein